jgi:hypothetical protein
MLFSWHLRSTSFDADGNVRLLKLHPHVYNVARFGESETLIEVRPELKKDHIVVREVHPAVFIDVSWFSWQYRFTKLEQLLTLIV